MGCRRRGVDSPRTQIVRQRRYRARSRQYRLRARQHDDRSVPVAVSVGRFSFDQSGREDAHAARSARPDTQLYPCFGKMGDAVALDLIVPEAGAIYVMDRGYVDFRRLHALHQAGAFFVTRTQINMNYHRVYSRAVDKTTGLRFDQSIALDGFYTRQDYPQQLRRVGFVDPETGKRLIFLTNHFALPALT